MSKQVSAQAGILDLYAPKFGLDELGSPGEKIFLKVVVESSDRTSLVLFASYVVGSRHVQIATKKLAEFGPSLNVVSVSRYSEDNFIADVNEHLSSREMEGNPKLVRSNEGLSLRIGGRLVPAKLEGMYTAAARIYAVIHSQQTGLRIAFGDKVELFDLQRRRLVGMRMKGEKLMLERAFQNP